MKAKSTANLWLDPTVLLYWLQELMKEDLSSIKLILQVPSYSGKLVLLAQVVRLQ